jgi:hypothetical protein
MLSSATQQIQMTCARKSEKRDVKWKKFSLALVSLRSLLSLSATYIQAQYGARGISKSPFQFYLRLLSDMQRRERIEVCKLK